MSAIRLNRVKRKKFPFSFLLFLGLKNVPVWPSIVPKLSIFAPKLPILRHEITTFRPTKVYFYYNLIAKCTTIMVPKGLLFWWKNEGFLQKMAKNRAKVNLFGTHFGHFGPKRFTFGQKKCQSKPFRGERFTFRDAIFFETG